MKNLSFLLLTYDEVSFLWPDYFRLTKKYWPNFQNTFDEFYMTTDEKNFIFSESIIIKNINLPNSISLSERIKEALKTIKSDYVFVSNDDYYLKGPVDEEKFQQCIEIIQKDESIDCIEFENFRTKVKKQSYNYYLNILKKGMFICNLQNAIWRKSSLYKLLRNKENGWKFEYYGSVRAAFFCYKVLTLKKGSDFVFNYDFGWLMQRTKFDKLTLDYFIKHENVSPDIAKDIGYKERTGPKKHNFLFKPKHLILALFSIIKK